MFFLSLHEQLLSYIPDLKIVFCYQVLGGQAPSGLSMQAAAQRAASMAAALSGGASAPKAHYEAELEINDFPQHARWKVSHMACLRDPL